MFDFALDCRFRNHGTLIRDLSHPYGSPPGKVASAAMQSRLQPPVGWASALPFEPEQPSNASPASPNSPCPSPGQRAIRSLPAGSSLTPTGPPPLQRTIERWGSIFSGGSRSPETTPAHPPSQPGFHLRPPSQSRNASDGLSPEEAGPGPNLENHQHQSRNVSDGLSPNPALARPHRPMRKPPPR